MPTTGMTLLATRLWKKVDNITTYFLYSDEGLLAECSSDGTARTYGPARHVHAALSQTKRHVFLVRTDLGIPHKLIESNGTVVWNGAYDAFGKL